MVRDEACDKRQGSQVGLRGRARVFEGVTYTFEDDRFSYGEQPFIT